MTSPRCFFGYWLWPVLDDETGALDYWDIHEHDDARGEGQPLAEGLSTLDDAKDWVRVRRHEDAFIRALDQRLS